MAWQCSENAQAQGAVLALRTKLRTAIYILSDILPHLRVCLARMKALHVNSPRVPVEEGEEGERCEEEEGRA